MPTRAESGSVRLIGGRWRGRRLPVPTATGLRPTPDRVRETLFNWLAPVIIGSRCLDCFAGSGALGLEAASRGAAAVTLLERDPGLARGLAGNIARLDAAALVQVHTVDALAWLARPPNQPPFDIVLLDPPFASDLLAAVLPPLAGGWIVAGGLVYLETARDHAWPDLPSGWTLSRDKTAGGVRYALAVC